jgi:pimeloyl-ACP methyl ester carboxylesterase
MHCRSQNVHRRLSLTGLVAVLVFAACASAQAQSFASDRISVVTRGSGPDVIMVPGLAGHREEAWGGVIDTLDDRYRLHLVQVSGFAGTSAGANTEGTVAAPAAEEIARYIRDSGLTRPAVIGHSLGGSVGMMIAARHPDLVGRLLVVDMTPYMGDLFAPGAPPEALRAVADQMHADVLASPFGGGMLGQMFPTMTLRADLVPTLMRHVRESDPRTLANAFREAIVTDLRPELGRITAPVTVLYVQPPDVPLPSEQFDAVMRALYANAPRARLIRIDDSRHFLQWDQPARFVTEVDALMRR